MVKCRYGRDDSTYDEPKKDSRPFISAGKELGTSNRRHCIRGSLALTTITTFLPTMVPHSATHRGAVRRGRSRSGGLDPRPRPP